MSDSNWRDEIIAEAKKWPRTFRARLDTGHWNLMGANEEVQQEFRAWGKRIHRELRLPQGDVDPIDSLLYHIREKGRHVRLSEPRKTLRFGSSTVVSTCARARIHPLRSALIEFVGEEPGTGINAKSMSRAQAGNSGAGAAAKKNRERQAREGIIRAFHRLGTAYSKWPDFVQEFYTNTRERTEYRQLISPPPFQPPVFDRLNQSPEDWRKSADATWEQHGDRFLRGCDYWVTVGVDDEIPVAKPTRGTGISPAKGTRGDNTDMDRRYEWAAKYLVRLPLKEIAAQDSADPSTVGRIARGILRQANWSEQRKAKTSATTTVYTHQEYPKCKYHPSLGTDVSGTANCKIVRDSEEEKALGEGWYDTPAAFSETRT